MIIQLRFNFHHSLISTHFYFIISYELQNGNLHLHLPTIHADDSRSLSNRAAT